MTIRASVQMLNGISSQAVAPLREIRDAVEKLMDSAFEAVKSAILFGTQVNQEELARLREVEERLAGLAQRCEALKPGLSPLPDLPQA